MQKLKVPRYIQWIVITGIIFLLLMTLLRFALAASFNHPKHFSGLLPAFVLGFRYDLRMVSIACLLIFLIGSFKPLHPLQKKAGRAVSFALWGIFIVMFCFFYAIDFAHYAYLSQRLNGSVLNYLDDAKISLKMVWQTYHVIEIVIALIAGVFLLLWIVRLTYNYILSKKITSTKRSRLGWSFVLFIGLGIGIFGRLGQYPLRWSDAFTAGDDYKAQISLNPFQPFFSSLNYRHATYNLKKVKQHYPWMAAHLKVTNPDSNKLNYERIYTANKSTAPKPNVVLVICESFSAYKSSMIGNPLNTTPYFNQMVTNGIYFDHCFSPSYGTARGVWATITGIPDVQLYKTASRNPAAVDQHTIINNFNGYEKLYFLGGSTSWANIRGLLTNNIAGLRLYEEGSYKAAKIDVWGISDKNLFLEANKVLGKQQKPFFAIIQTADNHRPYTIPPEDLKAFKKKDVPKDTLLKYGFSGADEYNAFRYTDFSFEQFIEAAKREKYFNNTIFVFVGDHGIRGDAGDMLPKAFTDQNLTAEHIPLLIYAPSLLRPARYAYPASQLDILPTIAGLCNISYRNNALGNDLLNDAYSSSRNAFIIDIDTRRIGMVQNGLFYSYNLNGSGEQICSILNNEKVIMTDSLHNAFRKATDAYYETARYLLLNNKKKKRNSYVTKVESS